MRVGLVTPGFPPARGGVEAHTAQLARHLSGQGHQVQVLTARRGLRRRQRSELGAVAVLSYPAWSVRSLSISPRLLLGVLREYRRSEVLHVHSFHALSGCAALLGRRIPVVLTPHYHGGGHSPAAVLLHRGYRLIAARLVGSARQIICVSAAEQSLLTADFPELIDRITVIPNGTDVAAISSAVGYPDEPVTVLSIGRLEQYKRIELVLTAIASISSAQLVVIGDGPQRQTLVRLAAELGVTDRVRIVAGLTDHDVHRWLQTAAVVVSMSEHEAFGMVAMEAAAAGARVLLSDIPAHRELAERYLGESSVLCRAEPAAVRAALRSALALAAAEPARVPVPVPDWAEVANRTEKVYLAALDASLKPGSRAEPPPAVGRRMDLLDRPWSDHWCAAYIADIAAPTVPQVRQLFARYWAARPDSILAGRLSFADGRWLPIAEAELADHLERVIVAAPAAEPGREDAYQLTHRAPPDWDSPFRIVVGPSSLVVSMCHSAGDGATFSSFALLVAQLNLDGLLALERADFAGVARSTLGQLPRRWRAWSAAVGHRRTGRAEPPAPTRPHPAPRPSLVSVTISNADLRQLTKWRNRTFPGASLSAVLTAAVHRALTAAGIAMVDDGYHLLIDTRRYLTESGVPRDGNLAKSLRLAVDPADPAAVFQAQSQLIDSGWALPGLAIGAVLARGGQHAPTMARRTDSPTSLAFSLMPSLPGLAELPWLPGAERRFVGLGYPTSPNSISVFAIRMREHLELGATFDAAVLDSAAVRNALESIADVPSLFG